MQQPRFTVATTSVLLLAALGVVVRVTKPLLPKEEVNRLQFEKAEYLRRASVQYVHWKLLEPGAFAEARRTGRPVLLVVGTPWSAEARLADKLIFVDQDVVTYLNNHFVCIRVDGETDPTWLTTYLPLTRPLRGVRASFQAWLLAPEGRLVANIDSFNLGAPIDVSTFLSSMFRAQEEYDAIRAEDPAAPTAGAMQTADLETVDKVGSEATPNFALQSRTLVEAPVSPYGGYILGDRVAPSPQAFRYLLRTGNLQAFRERVDPLLRSPLVDWLDGGFFAALTAQEPPIVQHNKVATQNAEMMSLLAQASIIAGDPYYRRLAESTFDCLAGEFQSEGLIASCRFEEPDKMERSTRSSFSPKTLRDTLSPEDREWARQNLGLKVEDNPQMTIWVTNPAKTLADPERLQSVLDKLREVAGKVKLFGSSRLCDVNGFVIARMLESARMLNDADRLSLAEELYRRLEWFRAGDDVKRSLAEGASVPAYLGDYLGYADAALQYYLATGIPAAFEEGLRVLLRAKFLFESDVSGVWYSRIKPPEQPGPLDVQSPDVFDGVAESLTSKAMSLQNAYGRLLRNVEGRFAPNPGSQALALCQSAIAISDHYGAFSDRLAFFGSGFFSASLGVLDDQYAVTVGPRSVNLARELFGKVPTRLVSPATGKVRPDLQLRQPGIYVIKNGQTFGPLSLLEAAAKLDVTTNTSATARPTP